MPIGSPKSTQLLDRITDLVMVRANAIDDQYLTDRTCRWEISVLATATEELIQHGRLDAASATGKVSEQLSLLARFPEARRLLEKAIQIMEKNFEPDHPTLASSYSNLALVLQDLGDLPEAKRLLEKAVDIRISRFGVADAKAAAYRRRLNDLKKRTDT